jgi:hypothetical protein
MWKPMKIGANARKNQENSDRFIRKYVKFRLFHYNPPKNVGQTFNCASPLKASAPYAYVYMVFQSFFCHRSYKMLVLKYSNSFSIFSSQKNSFARKFAKATNIVVARTR